MVFRRSVVGLMTIMLFLSAFLLYPGCRSDESSKDPQTRNPDQKPVTEFDRTFGGAARVPQDVSFYTSIMRLESRLKKV